MGIASVITGLIQGVATPITGHLNKRLETKQVEMQLKGKLAEKKLDATKEVVLSEKEWELISKRAEGSSWKDEYVTVSIISIMNIIVLGGLATAFGFPEVLEGIILAIETLVANGVDVGGLIKVTVYAALGIYVVKRAF